MDEHDRTDEHETKAEPSLLDYVTVEDLRRFADVLTRLLIDSVEAEARRAPLPRAEIGADGPSAGARRRRRAANG